MFVKVEYFRLKLKYFEKKKKRNHGKNFGPIFEFVKNYELRKIFISLLFGDLYFCKMYHCGKDKIEICFKISKNVDLYWKKMFTKNNK